MTAVKGAVGPPMMAIQRADAWRDTLGSHRQNIIMALATEDMTYVQMHSIMTTKDVPNPSYALMATGAPDSVDSTLKQINADAAQAQQDNFEKLKKDADDLKTQPKTATSEGDWKLKLNARKEQAKKDATDAIDSSFDKAETYISKLPPEQREPATTVFSTGVDIVSNAVKFVWAKAQEVIGAVADYLRGIWDTVTRTYDAVKGFVSNAIGAIKGFFGFGAIQQSSSSSENGMFEGTLTWKADTSLTMAATTVDTTCEIMRYLLESRKGKGPQFSIVSTIVTRNQGLCTANVLFNASSLASELGKQFAEMFEPHGTAVTWAPRGVRDASASQAQGGGPAASKTTTEVGYTLTWAKSNPSINAAAVEATLNYLQDAASTALGPKIIVQTGEVQKTSKVLLADITCSKVPSDEADHVSGVMKGIFDTELSRTVPIPNAPQVPTPDTFTFQ